MPAFDSDIITIVIIIPIKIRLFRSSLMKNIFKKLELLWVFLGFSAGSVLITWPLCLHLKTSVIGGMGDNIYFVWLIRWYQKVFLEGQGHPFFNPMMNYPQGWNLSTTETALASALPGVPFSWLFGPIAGYNIAMLITFVLAGFFMYLWVRDLTSSKPAALLAGMLFAFSPYHIAHFVTGHLNLAGIQWFPLFFWGLTKLLGTDRKLDWKFTLLTGLSLGLIAFTSMYYLYMTVIFTLLFVIFYLCFLHFKPLRSKYFWLNLVLAAIISLPFLYFSLRPFVNLSTAGVLSSRSLEYASMYSASPTDFFLPSTDHFLLGHFFSQGFDRSLWGEGSLYIGFTALILAVFAIIKRKQSDLKTFVLTAAVIVVVSFILGLGINLHWNNQSVVWQIPDFLQPLLHKTETLIYLPAAWLFNHLPFFDKMRTIMRFGFYVLLFIPVLAGIGFSQILARFTSNRRIVLTGIVFLVVLFEIYPGNYDKYLSEPQPRQVDMWLANQPDDGAMVQMPFSQSVDQSFIYYSLFNKKPFVGGFFNANQPIQYLEIQPILAQFPDEHSVDLLKELGVYYIVVDSAAYPDLSLLKQQASSLGLVQLTNQEGQIVYTFSQP
ncbi:MAG: hypothetical protein ACD_34C00626G0003 [uncultured bacterium]|nr:MAG: hypothetical protein ACD_34C00626G0003 [uncultured bacterium]